MGQFIYYLLAAIAALAVLIVTSNIKKQVDENLNSIDEMELKYKNKTLK